MKCAICEIRTVSEAQNERAGICEECEIEYHACSTGDCPHSKQSECDADLAQIKAEQNEAKRAN